MTIFSVIAAVGIVITIAVLMKVLYGQKEGPTPCIGCGACIATGKCVMRRREAEEAGKKADFLQEQLTKPGKRV